MGIDEFISALNPGVFGEIFGGFGAMIDEDKDQNNIPDDRYSTLGDGSCDWVFKPTKIRKLLNLA